MCNLSIAVKLHARHNSDEYFLRRRGAAYLIKEGRFHDAYLTGCRSLRGLHEWFEEFWWGLLETGFAVRMYTIDADAIVGEDSQQIVFNSRHSSVRKYSVEHYEHGDTEPIRDHNQNA